MKFNKFKFLKMLHGCDFGEGGEYRVLVTLLDFADENGKNAYPGVRALSDACAMGQSTVRRHLESLCTKGWIHQESRGRGSSANRSGYSFPSEVPPDSERKNATKVPLNTEEVPPTTEQSTAQYVHEKPGSTRANKGLSDHYQIKEQVITANADAKKETIEANQELTVAELDELTEEFLSKYPKPGNHNQVRDALRVQLNTNGGIRHFPVLLAYTAAYVEKLKTEGNEQYFRQPVKFLADGWYLKNAEIPKTEADLWQGAYDGADLHYPCRVKGFIFNADVQYNDEPTAEEQEVGRRPDAYRTWPRSEQDKWDASNRRRFIAWWANIEGVRVKLVDRPYRLSINDSRRSSDRIGSEVNND